MDLSFSITQTFYCDHCSGSWNHSISIPFCNLTDNKQYYTTTLKEALTRAIYAANCVLFGNTRLEDLDVGDLRKPLSEFEGHNINLKCKVGITERTCPSCMYPEDKKTHIMLRRPGLLGNNRESVISSMVIPSLAGVESRQEPTIEERPHSDSPSDAKPLSENPPENISQSQSAGSSVPVPAPRPSLQREAPYMQMRGQNPGLSTLPQTGESQESSNHTLLFSTLATSPNNNNHNNLYDSNMTEWESQTPESEYEIPSIHPSSISIHTGTDSGPPSCRPPPPPIDPASHVIDCHQGTGMAASLQRILAAKPEGYFALVKSPAVDSGGRYRIPFLLFCAQLEKGYTSVFQTPTDQVFISSGVLFNNINGLITHYRHHPVRGGHNLNHQLTLHEWESTNNVWF